MRKSVQISFAAVFGALHAVLYLDSFGLWRNWGIYLEAVEGIVLGPKIGFLTAFLGSSVARMIRPDAFWMFGIIAEPVSVFVAGMLSRARWKLVLAGYAMMLVAYFIHPFGRALPLWTILDVLLAFLLVYPAAKYSRNLSQKDGRKLPFALVLISFVCIATDSLVRIFLYIPCGFYHLFFGFSFEFVYAGFVEAAISSYIEDLLAIVVSLFVGVPLLMGIRKSKTLKDQPSA